MLNFRNVNAVFCALAELALIGVLLYSIPVYVFAILFLMYSLILFYGCYYIGSNFFIKVICSAKTSEKVIAISFDDGPVAGNTNRILDILNEHNVKAAFFCIGNRISGNKEIIKQIADEGHVLGNHSFSHHFWFDMFTAKNMLADMRAMDLEMDKATGKTPKLFRPPYGVTNPNLKKAIIDGGYTPIGWNVRSMDTVIKDEAKLLKKISGQVKPGAVFLFHDTSKTAIAILPTFIDYVKSAGYQIVPLDKMLNVQAYA